MKTNHSCILILLCFFEIKNTIIVKLQSEQPVFPKLFSPFFSFHKAEKNPTSQLHNN